MEDRYKVRLCDLQGCSLCRIIDQSFDIAKCGRCCLSCCLSIRQLTPPGTKHNFNRFGRGIYISSCSSSESFVKIVPQISTTSPEADDYVENTDKAGTLRVVLVNRVIVGKPYKQRRNATNLVQPPSGYHSVSIVASKSQRSCAYAMNSSIAYRHTWHQPQLRRDCRLFKRCNSSCVSHRIW